MPIRAVTILLLLLLAVPALAKEEPITYKVKKGDTLWGISERFIQDPYYWPSLWANNPRITNPHFIYPGQKLYVYDDRIEFVPAEREIVQILEQAETPRPAEQAPAPVEAITIKAPAGGVGFIGGEVLNAAGTLVDTIDNRIMMGTGDQVFVELAAPETVTPGDRFTLVDSEQEIYHPVTEEAVGTKIVELGEVQITELHEEVATAVITSAVKEIERGALLLPSLPDRHEIELRRAAQELSGYILVGRNDNLALAFPDVIHVDLGSEDGLQVGNLLYVTRSRQATEIAQKMRGRWAEALNLPEVVLGAAVVIDTQPHSAAALIVKSVQTMFRGDRVVTATE